MEGISRRAVISAGVAALACAPLAGRALAAEGGASSGADAKGGSAKTVMPAVAGTPEALDATLVVGGMTLTCPSTWKQQSIGDRAFSLTDAAGDVCYVSTLDAQVDMTSDATKATSLLNAFATQVAGIDAGDAGGAPHYLSAVARDDTDGVASGSASMVNWSGGELWNGRMYVAGDGTTTYVVNGAVLAASESAPAFLATMDAMWAARSIAVAAPAGQGAAQAAAGTATTAQSTSNPDAKYLVTIDGCTPTTDYDGNQAVIITFTFTNNSDEAESFASATIVNVYQDGVEQDTAFVTDIDTSNYLNKVKPGATATIQLAYKAPSMSDIEVEVTTFSFLSSETLATATFPLA